MKPIPPFIIELIQRLASEKPQFFKWVQTISGVIAAIAFIPDVLVYLDIPTPTWLEWLHNSAVKVGAITAMIVAQLPNKPINDKA